ncbi:MAG: DNA internalization-related competence protein ComEC/Rec2 [Candidatus Aphodocola sp.]
MSRKIKYIIFLICIISFVRVSYVLKTYKNICVEENKTFVGVITNIKKDDKKIVIDVRENDKYRITIYKDMNLKIGDKVKVKGIFKNAPSNTVFNLFSYHKYLLTKNIKLISNDASIKLISRNKNPLYYIKNAIIDYVNKYKSASYLKTFILADTSMLDDEIKDSYQNMGISHLFAVSGMHVGIFLFVLNIFFKENKYKNLIYILFLLFFLFITGIPESLLRCFTFFCLNLINKYFKLNIKTYNIVIISSMILLILNPYLIYSVGFLFSITITFFITLSNKYLTNKSYFKKILIISFISFLSSLPILASCFFKINFLSLVLNIIFVPFVSIILFPLGLMTFIFPFIDTFYFKLINVFELIVTLLDKIKILSFALAKPNIIMIILYYLVLYMTIKVNKKYIIIYLIILFVNLNMRLFITNSFVTFLDVGQGDSVFMILPKGKTILIDTGGKYMSDYSIVKNKTIPYLNSLGINKINSLVLTHGDYDHIGEAVNLVNNFKVEKVIFNCEPYNDLEQELIKVLDKKKIKYYSCIKELNIDNNKLYFLQIKEYDNENDNSNVIYTELSGYKFMFMGDAGVEKEKDILEKYNLSNIDVLKVGHHGSRTSSSKEFIKEIKPKYSIISVGKNNRYGHPNKEVLNNLDDSKIYRTDQDGSIMFKIKNNKLKIKTCSP